METQTPTDNASAAQAEPFSLVHPASRAVYQSASRPGYYGHSEVDTLAKAIALLERSVGNVPTFVDPEAELWLRQKAQEMLMGSGFKVKAQAAKDALLGGTRGTPAAPNGVRLLHLATMLGTEISLANSEHAHRALVNMADACAGRLDLRHRKQADVDFQVLAWRIERAIRENAKVDA